MKLTKNEKESILNMQTEDEIIINDYTRSDCHYEIQRITDNLCIQDGCYHVR